MVSIYEVRSAIWNAKLALDKATQTIDQYIDEMLSKKEKKKTRVNEPESIKEDKTGK